MSQLEQEIKHNLDQGRMYADQTASRMVQSWQAITGAAGVFWHEYSTEYVPGLGYLVIEEPSLWNRLRGGSQAVPKVVRTLKCKNL